MNVHYIGKPVWDSYNVNDAIHRQCPNCHAEARTPCINPITGSHQKMPCLSRLKPERTDQ